MPQNNISILPLDARHVLLVAKRNPKAEQLAILEKFIKRTSKPLVQKDILEYYRALRGTFATWIKFFFDKLKQDKILESIYDNVGTIQKKYKLPTRVELVGSEYIMQKLPTVEDAFGRSDKLNKILNKFGSKSYITGVNTAKQSLKQKGTMHRIVDPKVLEQIENRANMLTGDISNSMFEKIKWVIQTGFYRDGKGPIEVARMLRDEFSSLSMARSKMIARTETAYVQTRAKIDTFKEYGVKVKTWMAGPDPCPICDALDGKTAPIDGVFEGGYEAPPDPHPNCFTSFLTPIYTSKGFKPIGRIKVGDLVLTHRKRFKKVQRVFKQLKQDANIIKIFYKFDGDTGRHEARLVVTENHLILVGKNWIPVKDVKVNDKVNILANKCKRCGKLIPWWRKFCSRSCASFITTTKQWLNYSPEIKRRIGNKIRIAMKEKYVTGERDRKKITENAHKKTRELVDAGLHVFQNPETHIKANRELGRRNYGNTWIEKKLGWMLNQIGLKPVSQFPIRNGKDVRGQNRFYFVDFAFPKFKLAIECDGDFWHKDKAKDDQRQKKIESHGWMVLRFTGEQIKNNLMGCGREVQRVLANHNKQFEFLEIEVAKIEKVKLHRRTTLYNFAVEDDESYIAKGFVVHNCRCNIETFVPEIFETSTEVPE